MSKLSGIYLIKCIKNGGTYVGSAVDLYNRKSRHFSMLNKNSHPNPYLQNAFNKYGFESFVFEILEIVEDISVLVEKEQQWINMHLMIRTTLFNIRKDAKSNLGIKISEEGRENIRKGILGKRHSEATKKKISESNKGKKFSQHTIEKMSLAKKGKPSHFKGKQKSLETKQKISNFAKSRTGIKNSNSKLTQQQIQEICIDFNNNELSIAEIAKKYNVSCSTIKRIKYNKSYIKEKNNINIHIVDTTITIDKENGYSYVNV